MADGQRMLKRAIEGRWLTRERRLALYPADRGDDDIESMPTSRAARC